MVMLILRLRLIIRTITATAIINDSNDNLKSPPCDCCPEESSGPCLASPSLDRVSLGLAGREEVGATRTQATE